MLWLAHGINMIFGMKRTCSIAYELYNVRRKILKAFSNYHELFNFHKIHTHKHAKYAHGLASAWVLVCLRYGDVKQMWIQSRSTVV